MALVATNLASGTIKDWKMHYHNAPLSTKTLAGAKTLFSVSDDSKRIAVLTTPTPDQPANDVEVVIPGEGTTFSEAGPAGLASIDIEIPLSGRPGASDFFGLADKSAIYLFRHIVVGSGNTANESGVYMAGSLSNKRIISAEGGDTNRYAWTVNLTEVLPLV